MSKKPIISILFAVVCSLCSFGAVSAHAGEVSITAAADLQYAMPEIIKAYESKNPGDKVNAVFGSSGKAYSQISSGAPYDIFFSADIGYPEKLKSAGLAIADTKPYAIGRIGLWATKKSGIDVSKGPNILLDKAVKKVAIANPAHAPYGRAAVACLKHYKLYEKVKEKIVMGENIQQTTQFVETGAAEVGLIAYSLALAPALAKEGNFYLLPADSHNEILQGYVLLKRAKGNDSARRFEAFLGSLEARKIFKRYGFVLPHE